MLSKWLGGVLASSFPKDSAAPIKPFVGEDSWGAIRQRAQALKAIRINRTGIDSIILAACLRGWHTSHFGERMDEQFAVSVGHELKRKQFEIAFITKWRRDLLQSLRKNLRRDKIFVSLRLG